MAVFTDQVGNSISLKTIPKRIISLVPSQTELLSDLGLDEEIVGITKFCVHPESWFRTRPRIGGTKQLHIDMIRDLQPDLVIANKEENTREQVEAISVFSPVWTSDVSDIDSALDMIRSVGQITGTSQKAESICQQIKRGVQSITPPRPLAKALYLVWKDPFMSVGNDTFIHHMMELAGFDNVMKEHTRYPVVDTAAFAELNPAVILLSSEPYPFNEKHYSIFNNILPNAKVMLVDGEMFSWYGSRILRALAYFKELQAG